MTAGEMLPSGTYFSETIWKVWYPYFLFLSLFLDLKLPGLYLIAHKHLLKAILWKDLCISVIHIENWAVTRGQRDGEEKNKVERVMRSMASWLPILPDVLPMSPLPSLRVVRVFVDKQSPFSGWSIFLPCLVYAWITAYPWWNGLETSTGIKKKKIKCSLNCYTNARYCFCISVWLPLDPEWLEEFPLPTGSILASYKL